MLIGSAYPMVVGQPLLDAAAANDAAAIDMITIFGHSYASRLGHNPIAGISVQNTAIALLERAAPGVLHADLMACHQYAGGEQAAAVLRGRMSSVLIAGDSDRMTPSKGSKALAELLAAEFQLLGDCGHMMMSEQPEACLQAMRGALSGAGIVQ